MRLWNDAGFLTLVGLLGSCADLVVRLLYDSRYADAGWILQWLSIQAGMGFMLTSAETLLFSVGLTYFGFARSLARCLWVFAGIPLGWHLAGLPGVVVAVATSEIPVMLVLWTGLVRHGYLRILSELRAFAIWGAAAAVGALLSGLVR
jgi:O-antigen/teichoic acid export membrane protein